MCIIGIGNCGSQIAYLAEKTIPDLVDTIYINTSQADLSQVGDSKFKIKIGEDAEGSGKNRDVTKKHLRESIRSIIDNSKIREVISEKDYVFISASTAGGTGSGVALILFKMLKQMFYETNFILIAVLPQLNASMLEQVNTMEYLEELYEKLPEIDPKDPSQRKYPTYMIYDNDMVADMSPTEGLIAVNKSIVEDIRVLSGIDNKPTPFESIDEADMENVITTPGRLIVARSTKGITEKVLEDTPIDDIIIKSIKTSNHCELNRDKKIVRYGLISHLTEACNRLFITKFDKLFDFLGTPTERFNHNAVNSSNESLNFVYFIGSGLSPITDRIARINDRITELQEEQNKASVQKGTGIEADTISELKKFRNIRNELQVDVDIDAIFNEFDS
jgi:hypothetical protein